MPRPAAAAPLPTTATTARRWPSRLAFALASWAALPALAGTDPITQLADELLVHMRAESAYLRHLGGLPVTTLDDLTPSSTARRAAWGKTQLARLDALESSGWSHEQRLMAGMLRQFYQTASIAVERDALTFAVVPYSGGWYFLQLHEVMAARPLATDEDRTTYLRLIDDYGRAVDAARARTLDQAARGVRLPKAAIDGALATVNGLALAAPSALLPSAERLSGLEPAAVEAFRDRVQQQIAAKVSPAFEKLAAVFDTDYRARANEAVGLAVYPGGKELYLKLIRAYTGLELTPEEIHQRGLRAVGDLEEKMARVRRALGFEGSREEFHQALRTDAKFLAATPAEVEERYRRHVARIQPLLLRWFAREPEAGYDVSRLDEAAEPGMTYGYYQQPSPGRPMGLYRYNGSKLSERSLVGAAHLIYHELVPGHHFQIALQLENKTTHPVRALLDHGAFTEGWAEYAASLADEMGVMADPYDRYGALIMQAFLTSRLVVDTGMNYFGWSLERARQFMRDHTFESETQIGTESLRYSTDLYAQALCYRLGYDQFWALRLKAQKELGDRFDIRDFHEAVIGSGSMQLNVLAEHVDWYVGRKQAP